MKKINKSKVIIPALALIALTTAASVTGTAAWFSANQISTITGMTAKTSVSSNLLVSATPTEADFAANLAQTRSGLLEPVSTIDGENFYYADENIYADGHTGDTTYVQYSEAANPNVDPTNRLTNSDAGKTYYDAAFQTRNGISTPISTSNVCYGYLDYDFYIKGTSVADNKNVALTNVHMLYNSAAVTDKAWRIAVFASDGQTTTENLGTATLKLKSILSFAGATYFTSGQAIKNATQRDNVTSLNSAALIDSDIDTGNTRYYKVRVRLFLEGEDTTCKNETYASLTQAYSLQIQASLSDDGGVTNISTANS